MSLQGVFSTAPEPIIVLIVSIESSPTNEIPDTNFICGTKSSPEEKRILSHATVQPMLNTADANRCKMQMCEFFRYFLDVYR